MVGHTGSRCHPEQCRSPWLGVSRHPVTAGYWTAICTVFFAWAFELTPDGLKREHEVDRSQSISSQTGRKLDYAIIGVLIVALAYFAYDKFVLDPSRDAELVQAITETVAEQVTGIQSRRNAAEKSIAVLPFVNMSDDPGNEYFSDGIAEELMNVLVKVAGLRVASRTSSFSFKGKDTSIPGIAKALNVDHVLEGSVRKAGNTVRVTAQLIDVSTDSHLWSGTYDRELEDIFAIQDEISGQIVQALKVALRAGEQEAMTHAHKPTENLEAYELYLRGRFAWQLPRRGQYPACHRPVRAGNRARSTVCPSLVEPGGSAYDLAVVF